MKNKLSLILTLFLLAGCSGTQNAPAASASTSPAVSASEAQEKLNEQAVQMEALRSDSVYNMSAQLLQRGITRTSGIDGTVERDGSAITATVWMENGRRICNVANATDDMREAWTDLRGAFIEMIDGAAQYADENDFPVTIDFLFVDDADHDDILIEIVDGVIVSDSSGIAF